MFYHRACKTCKQDMQWCVCVGEKSACKGEQRTCSLLCGMAVFAHVKTDQASRTRQKTKKRQKDNSERKKAVTIKIREITRTSSITTPNYKNARIPGERKEKRRTKTQLVEFYCKLSTKAASESTPLDLSLY